MNNYKVVWVAVGAFLVGTMNQAYYQLKQEKILKKHIEILSLENELLKWFVNEAPHIVDREEMNRLLDEKREFLHIAKRMK